MFEEKTNMTYISFSIYQVYTVELMILVMIPVHHISVSETRLLKVSSIIQDVDLFQ